MYVYDAEMATFHYGLKMDIQQRLAEPVRPQQGQSLTNLTQD